MTPNILINNLYKKYYKDFIPHNSMKLIKSIKVYRPPVINY